ATRGISDLINRHGAINLDFADVRTIMKDAGEAVMGTGIAKGDERAVLAAQQAISSPLLDDVNIKGASGILINITGGEDMNIFEVNEACQIIQEEAGKDAEIIFGAIVDENIREEIMVTVIATGFNGNGKKVNSESEREINVEAFIENSNREIASESQPERKVENKTLSFGFEREKTVIAESEYMPAFLKKRIKN
ncbi:MAG: hypothetical protein DRP92_06990, partial [Candidatus Neomarinimicrobiota bacterium]